MAKQPSKSARADSSTGAGAAAVSRDTDAVVAAEPATEAPDAAVHHAVADDTAMDRTALLAVVRSMLEDVPGIIAELEAEARSSAQDQDHSQHALSSSRGVVRLSALLSVRSLSWRHIGCPPEKTIAK